MKGIKYLETYLNSSKVKKAIIDAELSERDVDFLMKEYEVFHHHLEKKLTREPILNNQ